MDMNYLQPADKETLTEHFPGFLESARTLTARGTFYNSRRQLEASAVNLHKQILNADRGAYAVGVVFPGSTEYTRQMGLYTLLRQPRVNGGPTFLTDEMEWRAIERTVAGLRPQKVLALFDTLVRERVNNARTRRLILSYILGGKLNWWTVKYRRKLARALRHAWGRHLSSTLRTILKQARWAVGSKEARILEHAIDRWIPWGGSRLLSYDAVSFILGNLGKTSVMGDYERAKEDLSAGASLPPEVVEGIRSTYHKDTPPAEVLKITKGTHTVKQKATVQKRAAAAGADIKLDTDKMELADLILQVYNVGVTDELLASIESAAEKIAQALPRMQKIVIVVDTSKSMEGHGTQKLRPIASALALGKVLAMTADVISFRRGPGPFATPSGDTSLAESVLNALKFEPNVVYVISDGYENAPAGRTAEVIARARELGIDTPVVHLNPVAAAEAHGVRHLGDDVIAVSRPEALPSMAMDMLLRTDVVGAISVMVERLQLEAA